MFRHLKKLKRRMGFDAKIISKNVVKNDKSLLSSANVNSLYNLLSLSLF